MIKLLKISTLSSIFLLLAVALQAQKFGHMNSGNILVLMPETKVADEQLKVFQDSLITIGEERAKKLEEEFNAFVAEYRQGNIPPATAQKRQAEFQQKEAELEELEEEIIEMVAAKREQLIAPVVDKVQNAINEVGKEGGYTMIFDTSTFNVILFAHEPDDVEPLVKAKLGVQ